MGPAPDGQTIANGVAIECGTVTDVDCVPGLSDGSGPGLNINANMFLGNAAESGSGGGIRFQAVNGTDVVRFPSSPQNWYSVKVTNNIIANNIFWQNRAFHLEVGGTTTGGTDYQQSLVTLHPTLNQPSTRSTTASLNGSIITGGTGACVDGATYWDIGVRGGTGPTNHSS